MRAILLILLFVSQVKMLLSQNNIGKISPIINEEKDSSVVQFLYKDSINVKSVQLISDLAPYFDNGINKKPQETGWLKKDANGWWTLTLKLPNNLRIPYRYSVTLTTAGKDSTYEVIDPLNNNVYLKDDKSLEQSILALRDAFPYEWERASSAPKWKKVELPSSEWIYIYTPAGYDSISGIKYPLFIGLSSFSFGVEMPTASIYESLFKKGLVKPCIFVLADYKSFNSINDLDSAGYYITQKVMPFVRSHYNVSTIAGDIIICGMSRRGMLAAYIGLMHSDAIGNVLSLSGSYYWRPSPATEYEWLSNQLAKFPVQKIRWYLAAGTLETVITNTNVGHYMLSANRHFRNILLAKQYQYLYEELPGGHNALNWQHGLYDGLKYLLAK